MGAYTAFAAVAVLVVLVAERRLRTGLFRSSSYWVSVVIVVGFQILVDGWLTKLSAPIVIYNVNHFSGVRFPWDIPLEDFAYGWSLVTLTMMLWERGGDAGQHLLQSPPSAIPEPEPGP
jgi:lycopene cyclase domain-containing protein